MSNFVHTLTLMTIGGLLAFCMEVAEFLLVTFGSSLTLAIVGVFKEVTILTLAVIRNGNEITSINLLGMVICIFGILAHMIRKAFKSDNAIKSNQKFDELTLSSDSEDFNDFSHQRFENRRNNLQSPIFPKEGLPLLESDSEEDSEVELQNNSRQRLKSINSDEYYFKESRTWTSTRDRHLEMRGMKENPNELFQKTGMEKCIENSILNLSDD